MLNARRLQVRIEVGVGASMLKCILGKSLVYSFSIKFPSRKRVDKCLDFYEVLVRKFLYLFD